MFLAFLLGFDMSHFSIKSALHDHVSVLGQVVEHAIGYISPVVEGLTSLGDVRVRVEHL